MELYISHVLSVYFDLCPCNLCILFTQVSWLIVRFLKHIAQTDPTSINLLQKKNYNKKKNKFVF